MAGGRSPNTDTLGLDAAGVATRLDGSIVVDDRLRTNVAGIWAVGDVNGEQPFTRVCQEEAKVAYADAFESADVRIDRLSLGHGIFTDPEIGSVGLTEAAARTVGFDVAVGLVTFDKIEKAELIGAELGLIKFVVERGTRRLLGCHVLGPQAADLVWSATVVLRRRGTLDELATAVGTSPPSPKGWRAPHPASCVGWRRRSWQDRSQSCPRSSEHQEVAMTPSGDFTCPACGADFDVVARLEEQRETKAVEARVEPAGARREGPVSFQCPACGADYETQEALGDEAPVGR